MAASFQPGGETEHGGAMMTTIIGLGGTIFGLLTGAVLRGLSAGKWAGAIETRLDACESAADEADRRRGEAHAQVLREIELLRRELVSASDRRGEHLDQRLSALADQVRNLTRRVERHLEQGDCQ